MIYLCVFLFVVFSAFILHTVLTVEKKMSKLLRGAEERNDHVTNRFRIVLDVVRTLEYRISELERKGEKR